MTMGHEKDEGQRPGHDTETTHEERQVYVDENKDETGLTDVTNDT